MPVSTSVADQVPDYPVSNGLEEPSLVSLVAAAASDARTVVAAEVEVYKAKLAERVTAYQGAVIFFAIAGVLALAGLIALLVGLILSLATVIGPGFATAVVVVTTFVIAGVLALIGKGRLAAPPPDLRAGV